MAKATSMSTKPFKLTSPKPYVPKEWEAQREIFLWAHGRPAMKRGTGWMPAVKPQCTLPGIDMLYATLNGVRLPLGLARKMRGAGMRPGPLDLILDVARGGWFGRRIELKREKGGTLSDVQKAWILRLTEEGFLATVERGAEETKKAIVDYLMLPRTKGGMIDV